MSSTGSDVYKSRPSLKKNYKFKMCHNNIMFNKSNLNNYQLIKY